MCSRKEVSAVNRDELIKSAKRLSTVSGAIAILLLSSLILIPGFGLIS
jgi:hypothetical protein